MKDLRPRLGKRLRELRRLRQLTQEQLGEKAGISYKFIGEIERGTGNPTVMTLTAIAEALTVHIVEFFTGEGTEGGTAIFSMKARDIEMVREALRSLDETLPRVTVYERAARRRRAEETR